MNDLPERLFANPVWHALQTKHRHLAVMEGDACRYPASVAPFAAVCEPSEAALGRLVSILTPGESVWLAGESYPCVRGLSFEGILPCLQMVLGEEVTPPEPAHEVVRLSYGSQSAADAADMVALTTLAFPGFFRSRTCEMGAYYGVRSGGELIAMGGERLMLDGYPEISGICTHPAHRGKGLAASLIWRLVRDHRRDGLVSWLHVSADNEHAIQLYRRLGFRAVRTVMLHRVARLT